MSVLTGSRSGRPSPSSRAHEPQYLTKRRHVDYVRLTTHAC